MTSNLISSLQATLHKYVTFVIGLPGSGKTWFIDNVLNVNGQYDLVIDDPKDLQQINYGITENLNMVIADPWLCDPDIRAKAEKKFNEVGWYVCYHWFENDPEKCMKNIKYRNDGRIITDLSVFNYKYPDRNISIMKIWTPPD
jgi:hypothetical protein